MPTPILNLLMLPLGPMLVLSVLMLFMSLRNRLPRTSTTRSTTPVTDHASRPRVAGASPTVTGAREQHLRWLSELNGKRATPVMFLLNDVAPAGYNGDVVTGNVATALTAELSQRLPLGGVLTTFSHRVDGKGGSMRFGIAMIAYLDCGAKDALRIVTEIGPTIRTTSGSAQHARTLPVTALLVTEPLAESRAVGAHGGSWTTVPQRDRMVPYIAHIMAHARNIADLGGGEPATATPTNDPFPRLSTWEDARDALNTVTSAFAAVEFSPVDLAVDKRMLADVTVPATARFYDAYATATGLSTQDRPADENTIAAFIAAVDSARRAWAAAHRYACDNPAGAALDEQAKEAVSTARKLLVKAVDESTPAPEAALSWQTSMRLLDKAGVPVADTSLRRLRDGNAAVSKLLLSIESGT